MNSDPAELASNLDNGSLESAAESESYGTSDVTARAAPTESLIDAIVAASGEQSGGRRQSDRLERFLADESLGALSEWFGSIDGLSKGQLSRRLSRDIARIDGALNAQLNEILHHPRFQRLEATWRGLNHLVESVPDDVDANIKIKVLDVTWKEVERDFETASEFDQSKLFKKVYEEEFGTSGGKPYGVLIADYEIHPNPFAGHRHDDIDILRSLAQLGAAAFCPVIANASPSMFGLNEFGAMEQTLDHSRVFEQKAFLRWQSLRDAPDTRFVGLTLPHVLMRLPYKDDGSRVDRFIFQENVTGRDHSKYLWGGAAFALGGVIIRSFAESGWLADIRGVRRGIDSGGLVTGLPVHCFDTDGIGVAPKCSTDVVIRDGVEKLLSDLGFIPLCRCADTDYSAFYAVQSIQRPKTYDLDVATVNASLSAMLQYILCASRFAHYIKILGRDLIGSSTSIEQVQDSLHDWIHGYVTADSSADSETKARYPLREAKVIVQAIAGKSGAFDCTMHLSPHYEFEEMVASVRLNTTLVGE
jgi:type VI secretion system ImpC/EvpB family protein